MRIFADYHTHTKFSHGKNTILENAEAAKLKGMEEIAISDHGFFHKLYSVKKRDLDKLDYEIAEAKEKTGINILKGIEANFISLDGDIDLTADENKMFDIVLCGFHYFVFAKSAKDNYQLFFNNMKTKIFKPSKIQIEKNTNTILRAMDKNRINILTHLNYGMQINTLAVAKHARDMGVLIELNGKRINFTDNEINEMVQEKVKFVFSSDAHSAKNVGICNLGQNLALRLSIPQELIINTQGCVNFKEQK